MKGKIMYYTSSLRWVVFVWDVVSHTRVEKRENIHRFYPQMYSMWGYASKPINHDSDWCEQLHMEQISSSKLINDVCSTWRISLCVCCQCCIMNSIESPEIAVKLCNNSTVVISSGVMNTEHIWRTFVGAVNLYKLFVFCGKCLCLDFTLACR